MLKQTKIFLIFVQYFFAKPIDKPRNAWYNICVIKRGTPKERGKKMKELKTGLEKNKKYTVDFCVKGNPYTTYIQTVSQKRAKEMLKEMFPDATNIFAKHYAEY